MSEERDSYCSVRFAPEIEIKVRGSRFLGQAFPAASEDEATARLARVRKRYHSATHHCSALRLASPERPLERSDDDGEPSGTAGPPILGAIQHAGVFDLIVVVTRYFGGTKLGTGGLVRAYGEAAREALDAAPRVTVWLHRRLALSCAYEDLGAVEAVLAREAESVHAVARSFDPGPEVVITVRRSRAERLAAALTEATAGRARLRWEE